MFKIFKNSKNVRELDGIIARIEMNASNNYKDEAQNTLVELEKRFGEMLETGCLSNRQKEDYSSAISAYKQKFKGYTHKDQKASW